MAPRLNPRGVARRPGGASRPQVPVGLQQAGVRRDSDLLTIVSDQRILIRNLRLEHLLTGIQSPY